MTLIESDCMDQVVLEKILALVHKYTGITMATNKKSLLQGRLRPRIRVLGISSYSQYLDYLNTHKSEVQHFVNLVTTNETSFFRTQRVWDYFTKEFLPSWFKENSKKTLRIWSAASSSGEEVYTIGICCEEFRQRNPTFNYQILGSDISTEVLSDAEKGEYKGRSIEGFKASNPILFDKYFKAVGEMFRISDEVKNKIRFNSHNLFQAHPQTNFFDVVFLRNVLIYFEQIDQEKVLSNIAKTMTDKGVLIIGESESLNGIKTDFQFVLPLVYEKRRG